jgi:SAM-dependent methyltransferase
MRFTRLVEELAPDARQVMDIGCGSGEQIISLASALPRATFTGVDISAANVAAATANCERMSLSQRVRLAAADYLEFDPGGRFDLIISWGTLQLIPGPSVRIFGKIAAELVPGGLLMNAMPYACGYNRMLMATRRAFRALRSGATDTLVLWLARLLHGHELDDDMLRQRVEYMYHVPFRFDSDALHRMMREECALELVSLRSEPHVSIAQAKHRMTVSRKAGPGP